MGKWKRKLKKQTQKDSRDQLYPKREPKLSLKFSRDRIERLLYICIDCLSATEKTTTVHCVWYSKQSSTWVSFSVFKVNVPGPFVQKNSLHGSSQSSIFFQMSALNPCWAIWELQSIPIWKLARMKEPDLKEFAPAFWSLWHLMTLDPFLCVFCRRTYIQISTKASLLELEKKTSR